ncbi:unnamed protein product, partial [marine sediment metagenome]
ADTRYRIFKFLVINSYTKNPSFSFDESAIQSYVSSNCVYYELFKSKVIDGVLFKDKEATCNTKQAGI